MREQHDVRAECQRCVDSCRYNMQAVTAGTPAVLYRDQYDVAAEFQCSVDICRYNMQAAIADTPAVLGTA